MHPCPGQSEPLLLIRSRSPGQGLEIALELGLST